MNKWMVWSFSTRKNQTRNQSQHESGECHFVNPSRKEREEFFSMLGLKDFLSQKLTLHNALEIREDTLECVENTASCTTGMDMEYTCSNPRLYPFLILQKIMAFDPTCRTRLVLSSKMYKDTIKILSKKKGDESDADELVVHPMDGLLAVLHCSDNFLRQNLMSKLATCQVAVPLILPDPIEKHKLTFLLWSMRSIVKELETPSGTSKEVQPVSSNSPLVTFLRIGKFKVSKSHIMNCVINDSEKNSFFHYNCAGGNARRLLVNGVVDVCWYVPSKRHTIFPELVTFANLHGDARDCPDQVKFLSEVSFMTFVFISKANQNEKTLSVLENFSAVPGGLVLLQMDSSDTFTLPLKHSPQRIKCDNKNEAELRESVCKIINSRIREVWKDAKMKLSLEDHSETAHKYGMYIDEEEEDCKWGKKQATKFETCIKMFRGKNEARSLRESIPLQGPKLWKQWVQRDKEQYRLTQMGQCVIQDYSQLQRREMERIRREQFSNMKDLEPLMKTFLQTLLNCGETGRHYFLQWIQMLLSHLSREQLPQLLKRYSLEVFKLEAIQKEKKLQDEEVCKAEILKLDKKITDASFGLEHLLREVSQIYEAVIAQESVPSKYMHYLRLPEVAAGMMIDGYPLELMDGDVAHVPETWVSAVLSKVQERLKNPRVFVLSVLGVQSSGKSTLLNTVFGVQFRTSAGRCTRGAFMQLLPIHSSLQQKCKCDYFLIIDTEGLRAPELAGQAHKHDNELATFVIGLANLTIINLSGETVGDMHDILQTTVHAFLRMKEVKLSPSCHFVHQNVQGVKVGEKTMTGHLKFKETLDNNTQAAAKAEKLEEQYKHFTDIIDFDSQKHVFYFQNLWKGIPPMASINPGYSTDSQCLKLRVIAHAKPYSTRLHIFQTHLMELWKAILHENFVFSFKNTLEITARNALDCAYSKWSWEFKQEMMTWEQRAGNSLKSCEISKLEEEFEGKCSELETYVKNIHQRLTKRMTEFFEENSQQEILSNWESKMVIRLQDLMEELAEHARNHCRHLKFNRYTFDYVDNMKETYTKSILSHVTQVASQLKKGTLNDKMLEEKFNEQWTKYIDQIKSLPVPDRNVCVRKDVESCLTSFEPLNSSSPMMLKKLKSKPLEKRGPILHLEVRNEHVRKPGWWGSQVKHGQKITDELLDDQRRYLEQMKQKHYNPNLTTDVLHTLFEKIPSRTPEVAFTDEYKVDIAITVCGYALTMFQKMVDTEEKENSPVEYLEKKMKVHLWKRFKNEYDQIAQEAAAASEVCGLLQHSVRKEVMASLSQKIADRMRKYYPFLQSKPALKAQILLNIGNKLQDSRGTHLADCLLYLRDAKKSLHYWLEQYTIQYWREGKFVEIALSEMSVIVSRITNTVDRVSKTFIQKGGRFKITEWLTQFHREIQSTGELHLEVKVLHQLVGVHQIKNVSRFKDEVMAELKKMESTLEKDFMMISLTEMDNWRYKPHDHLLEALAGCTEQCPFCKEQCDLTTPNHYPSTKHRVEMHRPQCLGRYYWLKSEKMVLDLCTTLVGTSSTFRNCDTEEKDHPYTHYDDFYPQWSIPADVSLKASLYWKWLLGKYADKIAKEFGMEETEIYSEWKELQWPKVKEDLKMKYKL